MHYVCGISALNARGISLALFVGFVVTVYVVLLNSVWHFCAKSAAFVCPCLWRLFAVICGIIVHCVFGIFEPLSVAAVGTMSVMLLRTVSVALVCVV